MGLGPRVDADLKAALKDRDQQTVSCLRLVRAALNNRAKDLGRQLTDEEELAVLGSLAKQRKDSIEQFAKGGRQDLVDQEAAELGIIEAYLPAALGADELARLIDEVFGELAPQGMKDMGRVMKETMARVGGRADGKLVSDLVRQRLAG